MSQEFDAQQWEQELRHHRDQKDQFFAEHRQSPIPAEEREAFDGLNYYDPDPAYRVQATFEADEGDETIEMEMTAGQPAEYERVGRLRFELDGEEHELAAYSQVGEERSSLFVPFRDKTTGQGTYGAGRYMELEVEDELEDGEQVPLDFNLAYHPFCAYNESFACPLPPEENWLDVAVEAGERL